MHAGYEVTNQCRKIHIPPTQATLLSANLRCICGLGRRRNRMNLLTKHKYDNFIPYLHQFRTTSMFEFSKEC